MLGQPGLNRRALVAGEVIRDQIQLACRVVQIDGLEQAQVADRVARWGRERQGVPIPDPQRPVKPDLVFSPAVLQRRFDPMSIGRPARGRRVQTWGYRPEFIPTDGRPGRVGGERDDGRPFGPKWRSVLFAHECVWRQGTPWASRMRRT